MSYRPAQPRSIRAVVAGGKRCFSRASRSSKSVSSTFSSKPHCDDHRQVSREPVGRRRLQQLTAKRLDRQLDAERGCDLARPGPTGDHDRVCFHRRRIRAFTHVDPALDGAPHERASHSGRIGDAVVPTGDPTDDVVRAHPRRRRGGFDRNPELPLQRSPLLELGETLLSRGEEEVADLLEERRAELLEEANARLGEPNLGLARELLAHAAHRLRCRAVRNDAAIAEDDVVGAEFSQVVGDARTRRS